MGRAKMPREFQPACPSEHMEQCALLQWWRLRAKMEDVPADLLFAIPNGGKRAFKTAITLRDEGVVAGVPDLFLAIAGAGYHGLFIEMKRRGGGRVSEAQWRMLKTLKSEGYAAAVCWGWDEAKAEICRYLGWADYEARAAMRGGAGGAPGPGDNWGEDES